MTELEQVRQELAALKIRMKRLEVNGEALTVLEERLPDGIRVVAGALAEAWDRLDVRPADRRRIAELMVEAAGREREELLQALGFYRARATHYHNTICAMRERGEWQEDRPGQSDEQAQRQLDLLRSRDLAHREVDRTLRALGRIP